MPFEIPQKPEVKVGEFQEFADALLRGCLASPKALYIQHDVKTGGTCAIGAIFLGMGGYEPHDGSFIDSAGRYGCDGRAFTLMHSVYMNRYGRSIARDNNDGMSREQIAARIAAL